MCFPFAQNVGHRLECYICWTGLCKNPQLELMCSCISNESCQALHCVLVTEYFQHTLTKTKKKTDFWRSEDTDMLKVSCLMDFRHYSSVLLYYLISWCQMLSKSFYLEIAEVMVYFTYVIFCGVALLFQGGRGRVTSAVFFFPCRAVFDCMNYHVVYQSVKVCNVLHHWQLLGTSFFKTVYCSL